MYDRHILKVHSVFLRIGDEQFFHLEILFFLGIYSNLRFFREVSCRITLYSFETHYGTNCVEVMGLGKRNLGSL